MATATKTNRLILASASPRRSELLRQAGIEFSVVEPPIPEPTDDIGGLGPAQQAEALAYFKARAVADANPDAWVLGADTIVAHEGRVLGKADDAEMARRMLHELSGTRHAVITGVALIGPDEKRLIASDLTYVTMREMTEEEVEGYVSSGEWEGKAGAYAIQETADRYVARVEGSFSNVIGLPIELTQRMISEVRAHPDAHRSI